jgi:hypothetical protein
MRHFIRLWMLGGYLHLLMMSTRCRVPAEPNRRCSQDRTRDDKHRSVRSDSASSRRIPHHLSYVMLFKDRRVLASRRRRAQFLRAQPHKSLRRLAPKHQTCLSQVIPRKIQGEWLRKGVGDRRRLHPVSAPAASLIGRAVQDRSAEPMGVRLAANDPISPILS